jgi:hypothetical protein
MQIKSLLLASLLTYSLFSVGCIKKEEAVVEPAVIAPNTYTLNFELALTTVATPNPKCFIDLDKGMVYDIQTAPAHAADIDLVWVCNNANEYFLNAPNVSYFSVYTNGFNQGELGMANWAVRNSCVISYMGSLAKGAITGAKSVADLKALIKSGLDSASSRFETFDGLSQTTARVFVFETSLKKRGAFIVNNNTVNSNGGLANITIRVEP